MPLIALAAAILIAGFQQLIEWKYGPLGIVGLLALTIGLKARNTLVSGVGAVLLVLLLAPAG